MSSVSVIVRAYNAEKYIRYAINSILNQNYNELIEIIVCYDEGTQDNTLSILKELSKCSYENRTVTIYTHTHLTPFRSLQYGLARSKGEYVMILDYDNVMPSNYISTMMKSAESSEAQFLFSNILPIDEKGNIIGAKNPSSFNFTLKDLILSNRIDGNTIMLRKDYAEKIKDEFKLLDQRSFDDLHEDWLIALLALKDCKPCYVKDAYILYRIHGENITAGAEDLYKILRKLEKDVFTLLAFYESRGRDLAKEELTALQIALMRRYTWSMRYISKYKKKLRLLEKYSLLASISRKVLEKLLFI